MPAAVSLSCWARGLSGPGVGRPGTGFPPVPAVRKPSEFLCLLATRDGLRTEGAARSSSLGRQPEPRAGPTGAGTGARKNKQAMADEALFLLLHSEMVSGVYKSAEQGEVENGRCITKLENMGFRVGQGLLERFTKDTARFKDELDIMKFICKDFWTTVFKKQIDNLRTNHQGIYVLQDNKFRLLTQMSAGKQYLEHASKYLAFTCGLIRGGLSNLGIKSIVTAEVSSMPACKFQVMIQKL
ncbi:trafficking protein particle complex subunit 6B [Diceros bicornis minor]|nr:PREDICTED: trafficking protein particle complex subunit 6B [Ceratotherium simum simum]XP_058396665.1 trafficking protein particle complex subunit 6B [Diceros bicornis minor]